MNAPINTNNDFEKAIERGDFRNCYLIYCRKSTDEPHSQKNSIEYQNTENTRYANRASLPIASISIEGFCVDGIISERHSGFKEDIDFTITKQGHIQYGIDRPKFRILMQYLADGLIKGVVCLCWDRISRNRGDDTIIRKLMRRGCDIRFTYATYEKSSAGELHMDVDSMFAQHHSRVTSEKVSITTRNLRSRGKCTYQAPIGYLNTGTPDYKPHDPERAPFITEIFELYDTGEWSLSDIARHMNHQGLTTVPARRPRTVGELLAENPPEIEPVSRPVNECTISRILANPFYTGKVIGPDGTYIPSTSHEPLVAEVLFHRVQQRRKKKNVSVHYTNKIEYPLRGLIRCTYCNRVYTPYEKKGILYFAARCRKDCTNTHKSCNLEFIAGEIRQLIAGLHISDDDLAEFEARTKTGIALLEEKRNSSHNATERRRKKIRADLAYLRTEQLTLLKTGVFSAESLVEERRKLEQELDQLAEDDSASESAMRETMVDIEKFSELAKHTLLLYDLADQAEKERIIRSLFSELFLADKTLSFKVKNGLDSFFDPKLAICDPIAWLSELQPYRPLILSIMDEIESWNKAMCGKYNP